MTLIDKETIRKEIERRTYNAHEMPDSRPDKQFYEGKDVAYGEILAFLDTIPEQPVEGLEEEISRTYHDGSVADTDDMDHNDYENIARHFAECGRKQVLQEIYDGKVKPVDKITAAWLDDEQNT